MALTTKAVGCSSTFTSGAPLCGARGSPLSSCRRARTLTPRSSLVLPGGDECNLSSVDYQDVTSQWISADFLDLRLRSSGLICNEAVQALRKHFQKSFVPQTASAANVISTTASQQIVAQAAPSASRVKAGAMPSVVVYDEALFSQLYGPGSTYATMSCFLDESFC